MALDGSNRYLIHIHRQGSPRTEYIFRNSIHRDVADVVNFMRVLIIRERRVYKNKKAHAGFVRTQNVMHKSNKTSKSDNQWAE